jgi:hypothetical protein
MSAPDPKLLEAHIEAGHDLIPLKRGTKEARDPGWPSKDYSDEDPRAWIAAGLNVGVRLREGELVVDFDPRHSKRENAVSDFCREFGVDKDECLVVETGGGGLHIYMKKPGDLVVSQKLADWPEFDFKKNVGYVVAAGSLHPNGSLYRAVPNWLGEFEMPMAPRKLLDAISKQVKTIRKVTSGEVSCELLEEMLDCLDPTDYGKGNREKWLKLGMACHHATSGEGRQVFVEWSARDGDFADDAEQVHKAWDSFDAERQGGVTADTLYKAVSAAGRNDLVERAKRRPAEEEFADEPFVHDDARLEARPRPNGLRDWVWVAEASRFVRLSDGFKFTDKQWKSMFAHLKRDGDILNAVWKGDVKVRKFESLVYVPGETTFPDGDGGRYNAWRPSKIAPRAGDVSWFVEHMEYLIPNERERELVLDYLASIVQRPADKAQFALLIRGDQGTGKSAVGELMRRIVGEHNVVKPNNDEIANRFNSWQIEGHLAIVEELMTLGRTEVANRLKPIITEPLLRVEMKCATPFSAPNHLNLICFTNHRDALKIEDGDRRWMIVFSPAKPQRPDYYRRLFQRIASDDGAAAVAHLLATRPVALDTKGRAPETRAKDEMRRLSRNEAEAHLLELFDQGAAPFDRDLVRLEDVVEAVPQAMQRRQRNLSAVVAKLLEESIGAVKHSRNTKDDGRPKYRLYSVRNHDAWTERGPSGRIDTYLEQAKALFDPVD